MPPGARLPPSGALKRLAGNAILFACSVALSLLAAEGIVRLFDLRFSSHHPISGFCQYDEVLGWRLVPGRTGLFKGREFSVRVEQSEQGLRDRSYPYERDPDRWRILVLGDSVVWCWGVEMSECFTEILEQKLPETDVIAAGVPGYGTAQEVLLYESDLARFRPDLVLLVFVINDLNDNLQRRNRPVFELLDGELAVVNIPVPRRKSVVKEWLLAHSRLFRQLNYAAQVLRQTIKMAREGTTPDQGGGYVPLSPQDEARAHAVTTALIERLARDVADAGGRLAIVHAGATRDLGRWLDSIARARDIPYLDLYPELERGEEEGLTMRLAHDPHFSPDAHVIAARAILGFLDDERLLRASGAP